MSTITVTNIKATGETASRAVSGVAAAWVDIGVGGSSVGDSVNVASLVDVGTGDYTINFTNNMSSVYYSGVTTLTHDTVNATQNHRSMQGQSKAASNFQVNGTYIDANGVFNLWDIETSGSATIHGDLA